MRRTRIVLSLLALYALGANAAPVTFDITPTFAPATGSITGYRAYKSCNQAAQTATGLVGPAVSGTLFSFAGDTATPPIICVRAWNAAGEGGFNAVTLTVVVPPGPTTSTYVCTLNPVTGGACIPQ